MDSLNDECPICLSCISTEKDDIYTTKCCKKNLHNTCYTEWIKIKPECPLCRAAQTSVIININEEVVITNFCYYSLRHWGTAMCGVFMCYSFIMALKYNSHKN